MLQEIIELFYEKGGKLFWTLNKKSLEDHINHINFKKFLKKSNHYCGMSNLNCSEISNTSNIETGHKKGINVKNDKKGINVIIFYNND